MMDSTNKELPSCNLKFRWQGLLFGNATPTTATQLLCENFCALPFWQYQFPHANPVNSSQDLAQKSHSQYPNLERVKKINETTVYASSGDNADFKYLHKII